MVEARAARAVEEELERAEPQPGVAEARCEAEPGERRGRVDRRAVPRRERRVEHDPARQRVRGAERLPGARARRRRGQLVDRRHAVARPAVAHVVGELARERILRRARHREEVEALLDDAGRLAARVALDAAVDGLEERAVDPRARHRDGARDLAVHALAHDDGVAGRDRIELRLRRQGLAERALPDDPRAGRRPRRLLADAREDRRHGELAHDHPEAVRERRELDVRVGVDHPRQRGPPVEIDRLDAVAGEARDLGARAERDERAVLDEERLGERARRVEGADPPVQEREASIDHRARDGTTLLATTVARNNRVACGQGRRR